MARGMAPEKAIAPTDFDRRARKRACTSRLVEQ
jgi:hypothetical protein